jgi:hemerythrin-like metal-binding protein
MKQYGYPDFEIHQKKHMRILQKVYEYRDILNNGELDKESFTEFLHEWIVAHTLTEDRKYTAFFNEKGLY